MRSPEQEDSGLYTIGQAAGRIGVSVSTLRTYEAEGLVIPVRRPSGHRLYSEDDIHRLHCIRRTITEDKVSIAGIRRLLALIPCWSIKGCPPEDRSRCPAASQFDAPCWTLGGRSWQCADADCRSCPVYTTVADCQTLKETIINLTTSTS